MFPIFSSPHIFPIYSPHLSRIFPILLPPHLVVDHPTAELLSTGPDDLAVVPGAVVEGTDLLTVEARLSDLVVPVLSSAGDDD